MPLYNVSLQRADLDQNWSVQIEALNMDDACHFARVRARNAGIPTCGGSIAQRAGHPASDAHFQQMFGDFQK